MYLRGVDLFDSRDPDDNNGDDGVSKCRFTITVFLPPCNASPVYLLPPNSPTLPYSLVSLNSHLILLFLFSRCLEEELCLFHIYVSITYALSHSSRIIKQGLEVQEWFWMVFKKNDLSLFFGSLSRLHQQRLNYDTGPHPPLYCPRTSLITFCCYNSSITSSNTTKL